jgi:uncharacterized protein (UPF0332 family)
MIEKKFLLKAEERIKTAQWALENKLLNSAVSNCYYALFNAMQAVIGKPPSGKWEHGGIAKFFCKKVNESSEFSPLKPFLKKFPKFTAELYSLRKVADYEGYLDQEIEEEIRMFVKRTKELIIYISTL